jgi:hypothetical protein
MRFNSVRFALVIALLTTECCSFVYAQSYQAEKVSVVTPTIEVAKKSAFAAQQACLRYVQMNIFEFDECIQERLNAKGLTIAERLGITYMGLVGALSGQRMGSQGSHMMAWEFAKKTQKIQKKLGLKDLDLCSIVPGDCQNRIARTQLTLKQGAPAPLTEAELAGAHRH